MRNFSRGLRALAVVAGLGAGLASIHAEAASSPIHLRGSATKLGSIGRSTISLSGEFQFATQLAMDKATVTVDALLDEVGGSEELVVGDFPMVLSVQPGAKPKTATYKDATGSSPKVRLDVPQGRVTPSSFILNVQGATIALPEDCSAASVSSTKLRIRFTIDDHSHAPLVVEGNVNWQCVGRPAQIPTSLKTL